MNKGISKGIIQHLCLAGQVDLLLLNNRFEITDTFLQDIYLKNCLTIEESRGLPEPAYAHHLLPSAVSELIDSLKNGVQQNHETILHLSEHNIFSLNVEKITAEEDSFCYLLSFTRQQPHSDTDEKLTFLENTLQIGVWRYNPDKKQFFGSSTTNELLNLDANTPADMRLDLIHFSTRSLIKLKKRLQDCIDLGYFSENLEVLVNNQSTWVNFSGYLQESNQHTPFILGTVQNCTAQIYLEAQNRLAIESSGIGLWMLDLNQDSLMWNKQMYDIYGLPESSQVSSYKDWQMRVHEEDIKAAEQAFQSAIDNHKDFQQVFRIITPQNTTRFVKARARTIYSDRGDPLKIVGANIDITDLKNEEQRTQQERERRFSIERLASIGELAAGIGHEINNPLAIMLGQLELLSLDASKRSTVNGDELERLNSVKEAGFRIRDIVAGLKSMSRNEQEDNEVDVSINDLLRATEKFTRKLYHHLNINIIYQIPNEELFVSGHFGELQQVLLNLVQNAKDATDKTESPTITIRASTKNKDNLQLRVTDNGEGIPAQNLDTIFDSFYTTKPANVGTGLGLSIVKRIIEQHQGRITVDSTPGRGTQFEILLPLCDPQQSAEQQYTDNSPEKPEQDITIVLVDDEPDLLEICTMYLSTVSEKISCFHSAEDALDGLKSVENMVFITDYTLPGLVGPEFIHALNEKFQTKVTCMLMTGGILSASESELPPDLFTSVITKPFTMSDFNKQVIELLQQSNKGA